MLTATNEEKHKIKIKPKWTVKGVYSALDCIKCDYIIEYKLVEDKVMILCKELC